MLPQRLLLHDPSAAVVLSATLWAGVGALNTNSITDITRHPFVTTASLPSSASSSSTRQSLSSAIEMNSRAAGRPILALCTQLIDLRKHRADCVTDGMEDGASFCSVLSEDTIQIFSRNWTVHIFKFHDDLQSILHDRENLIVPLEASGKYFSLLKSLVGFGLGRGGRWTRVGYIAAGAAARGSSPFSLSGTHWKGIGAALDMPHMNKSNGYMGGTATPTANHPSSSSSSPSSSSSSSSSSHVLPMVAALHLFESLSSLPDLPVLKISGPKTWIPTADSSFSSSSGSGMQSGSSGSRSGGLGFGFGFGNMSSKPRPAVIEEEVDSLRPNGTAMTATSTSKEVETARAAFCTALSARFQKLFLFCHIAAAQSLPQGRNMSLTSRDSQYYSDLAALSMLSLNPIDGDADADADADISDEGDHATAEAAVEELIELCDFLRPTVCALLRARTPEESALVMATYMHTCQRRGLSSDDIVLTYVLTELLCRLHAWSRAGVAVQDNSKVKAAADQTLSSSIAAKFCSLELDESALNSLLSALCESVLSGVSPQGQQKEVQVGGCSDTSRTVTDAGSSFALAESTDSKPGSTVSTNGNEMGGTSVINCLVSSSQTTLYQIFVVTAADKGGGGDVEGDGWNSAGAGSGGETAEERRKAEEKRDTVSLGLLIIFPSSSSSASASASARSGSSLAVEDGQAVDVFSLLARTKVALWLLDVSPLADLIARSAMLHFKAKKDSMDIFLEMVLAGQTDKLFMLAKADRNNTGTGQYSSGYFYVAFTSSTAFVTQQHRQQSSCSTPSFQSLNPPHSIRTMTHVLPFCLSTFSPDIFLLTVAPPPSSPRQAASLPSCARSRIREWKEYSSEERFRSHAFDEIQACGCHFPLL